MLEGLTKMRCGNCGGEEVRIYTHDKSRIFAECCKCQSLTEIAATKPAIEFNFPRGVDSDGILAAF
mgnify:FL=1